MRARAYTLAHLAAIAAMSGLPQPEFDQPAEGRSPNRHERRRAAALARRRRKPGRRRS